MNVLNTIRTVWASCCIFGFCTGCATAGAERAPLSSWSRQTFENLGLSVDLPQQPANVRSRYYIDVADTAAYEKRAGRKDLVFYCHPVWPGSFGLEPIYLMKIRLLVFAPGKAAAYSTKAFPNQKYPELTSTNGIAMQRGEEMECEFFRKDISLANGNKVICEAELMAPRKGTDQYAADTNAITRVFASIKETSIQGSTSQAGNPPQAGKNRKQ